MIPHTYSLPRVLMAGSIYCPAVGYVLSPQVDLVEGFSYAFPAQYPEQHYAFEERLHSRPVYARNEFFGTLFYCNELSE
jgi:hypothetical protein